MSIIDELKELEGEEIVDEHSIDFLNSEEIAEFENIFDDKRDALKTHALLNPYDVGEIRDLVDGESRISFKTNLQMACDEMAAVHVGNLFSSAAFAAVAAVNEENSCISGAHINFLTIVRTEEEVVFEAHSKKNKGRRRDVKVTGFVKRVKVFEGIFVILLYEKHPLALDTTPQEKNIARDIRTELDRELQQKYLQNKSEEKKQDEKVS